MLWLHEAMSCAADDTTAAAIDNDWNGKSKNNTNNNYSNNPWSNYRVKIAGI